MAKNIKVTSFQHFLYVDVEGKQVQIKEIDNPEVYGKDVVIYTKEAVKGANKGTTLYAVAAVDYIKKTRVGTKESNANLVQSLKAEGLSDTEILARLIG